jgi:predicted small lipoprotein YifL
MLRLHARASTRFAIAAFAAVALAGCGTKGPLVPAKKPAASVAPAPVPAPATTAPDIPSATLPSTNQPAP